MYLENVVKSFKENLKTNSTLPDLERYNTKENQKFKDSKLSPEAHSKYRRVLGQLAWAAITRCDLQCCVSFLARCQSESTSAAESTMRVILRFLMLRLTVVQNFPAEGLEDEFLCAGERMVVGYCDASWNVTSVTGFLLFWNGSMLKSRSRKQSLQETEVCLHTKTHTSTLGAEPQSEHPSLRLHFPLALHLNPSHLVHTWKHHLISCLLRLSF